MIPNHSSIEFPVRAWDARSLLQRSFRLLVLVLLLALPWQSVHGALYYVDSRNGADTNAGTSIEQAWRSLEKVNSAVFQPGDRVLFRTGSTWQGQLQVTANGSAGRPVLFGTEAVGPRPRINAAGLYEDAVLVRNAQHVILCDFEITNTGTNNAATNAPPRRGVHILGDNAGTLTSIIVSNLFIHDVNGTQRRKDNGGIIFTTRGERTPTRFDGLFIERNIIWRVDRSGIVAQSFHARRTRWFPSRGVVIRDNWLGDLGGDGITPWATDGCLVEHNIVQGANERAGSYNAGIWPWSTDNTIMRLNRASGVKTLLDGQGFDSDYNSHDTVIEYNLSHDNDGGFLLICSPGKRDERENCGNKGTIARYNISRHDGARTFHVSAAEGTLVHDNAVYVAPKADVQVVLLTDWSGWPDGLEVRDNLFHSDGVARYGHQVSRHEDGSYGLGPGWGPATNIVFQGNRYSGRHENAPAQDKASTGAPKPLAFEDWPGPQFDPREPGTFGAYIRAHREWMVRLMERQFGRKPPIGSLPASAK